MRDRGSPRGCTLFGEPTVSNAGFGSNVFLFDTFPQLNVKVKEGARGYTWVCSSSGAGFLSINRMNNSGTEL